MRAVVALIGSVVVLVLAHEFASAAETPRKVKPTVTVKVTDAEFSEQPHIRRETRLPMNATLVINLSSNPGSTGFEWDEHPKMNNPSVLKQTRHEFIEPVLPPGEPEAPGTPGNELWEFKPLKPGKTVISMEYSRPWEDGEKRVQTFTLTVVVK